MIALTLYFLLFLASNSLFSYNELLNSLTCPFFEVSYSSNDKLNALYIFYLVDSSSL